MSTTVTTHNPQAAVEKAAFWIALLALLAAVAGLGVTLSHVMSAPAASGSSASSAVTFDTSAKVAGGVVRPFETPTGALHVGASPAGDRQVQQYDDLPPAHLRIGPVG